MALAMSVAPAPGSDPKTDPKTDPDFSQFKGYQAAGGQSRKLLVISIEGMIDLGMAAYVKRSLKDVDANTTVLLRISTFGGRVDAAVDIRDRILALTVPSIAYVQHRAISAGALIALSADTLILDDTASMGAVTPVQQDGSGPPKPTSEKVVSYMRAEMRATAEAKGRRADVAEAMVDADMEVTGISEAGKLLTLTARDALEIGMADALVESQAQLLTAMGLSETPTVEIQTDWGERLASFLTQGAVSSLLMTLGMAGLMMELYSPGFGWGGAFGITCLTLFFGGHFAAQLAGWEELLILLVGLGLMAAEVLVIPGFGVAGVAGLLMIATSLVLAMIRVDLPVGVAFDLGYLQEGLSSALLRLCFVTGGVLALGVLMARYLPKSRVSNFLVFPTLTSAGGALGSSSIADGTMSKARLASQPITHQVGDRGIACSVLRPAGIAEFGGQRAHVVSEGPQLEPGTPVRVVSVQGAHVVVTPV